MLAHDCFLSSSRRWVTALIWSCCFSRLSLVKWEMLWIFWGERSFGSHLLLREISGWRVARSFIFGWIERWTFVMKTAACLVLCLSEVRSLLSGLLSSWGPEHTNLLQACNKKAQTKYILTCLAISSLLWLETGLRAVRLSQNREITCS